jgi:hypothetical protein
MYKQHRETADALIAKYAQGDKQFARWLQDADAICINRCNGSIWDFPRDINWYRLYDYGLTPSQAINQVLDEYELKGGY